jgi:ribosomal-protein-alanine N-acetyltransferase
MRDVQAADLNAVHSIELESFSKPWSIEDFEAELDNERSIFRLLEKDDKICGYFIVYTVLDESELANIAVSPEVRGQGYGKLLLKGAIDSAITANDMILEVENEPAILLYESFGFEKVGNIKNYYGSGKDAYIMKLNIKNEVRDVEEQC